MINLDACTSWLWIHIIFDEEDLITHVFAIQVATIANLYCHHLSTAAIPGCFKLDQFTSDSLILPITAAMRSPVRYKNHWTQ